MATRWGRGSRSTAGHWVSVSGPGSVLAGCAAAGLLVSGLNLLAVRGGIRAGQLPSATLVGTDIKPYAYELFTRYLLPVQVIGFLLLIAMIGVIVLSKRFEPEGKS